MRRADEAIEVLIAHSPNRPNIPYFYFFAFAADGTRSGKKQTLWMIRKDLTGEWKQVLVELNTPGATNDAATSEQHAASERLRAMGPEYCRIVERLPQKRYLERKDLFVLSFTTLALLTEASDPAHKIRRPVSPDAFSSDLESQARPKRGSLNIGEGDLLDHGMHFIVNVSRMPFITSDAAIFVDSWDSQQAKHIIEPLGILDTSVYGSLERVVVLPLSPQVALISSAFIRRNHSGSPYIECSSDETVFELNLLACYAADQFIISNEPEPLRLFESRARTRLVSRG